MIETIQKDLEEFLRVDKEHSEVQAQIRELDKVRDVLWIKRGEKLKPLTSLCSNNIQERFVKLNNGDVYKISQYGVMKLEIEDQ